MMNEYKHIHIKLNTNKDRDIVALFERCNNNQKVLRYLWFYYDTFREISPIPWLDAYFRGEEANNGK